MLMKNKYDPVFTGGEIWQIFNKLFKITNWEKQTIGGAGWYGPQQTFSRVSNERYVYWILLDEEKLRDFTN